MKKRILYAVVVGLCVGAFVSIFSVFFWLNIKLNWGIQPSNLRGLGGLMTILIQAIGIFVSIRKVRDDQGGQITYGQAFKTGFTIAIITALITPCFSALYCTVINPGYQDFMVNAALQKMRADGESAQQIAVHIEAVKNEYSTKMQVMQALIGQFVMGTALTLIMSPFIRSKKVPVAA